MQRSIPLMDTAVQLANEENVAAKHRALRELIAGMGRVIVAFSGGIDSTLVLKVAYDVLGENALGATAASPSLARSEREEAAHLARLIGVPHIFVETHELDNPNYAANPSNRCYFCKSELYDVLVPIAAGRGYRFILDGTNADDVGDFRPGQQAAREHGVRSPLREVGFTKAEIRSLARQLGLPNWDKPAMACLASRIPYGQAVTVPALRRIDEAEAFLRSLGFRQLRVRHHDSLARLEVEPEAFPAVLERREEIVAGLRARGYTFVALDLAGFRSGSMNAMLWQAKTVTN
jgi:uncharacterized protein